MNKTNTFRFAFLSAVLALVQFAQSQDAKPPKRFAIALHGGAGNAPVLLTEEQRTSRHGTLVAALRIGRDILKNGGTSLDAVEKVIRYLEDDPKFNAGRGAVFHSDGGHELDASIMDGRTKACGAVAGVSTVKNPISLARLVMTKTRHVLLATDGAERFATEMKVDRVEQDYFSTERQRRSWLKHKKTDKDGHMGTVGCVALDTHGNLGAGTSTGGLTNKKYGRIGDSPIVGAGTYADNQTCAVSCTGIGEHFIRNAVAYDVSARMAYQQASVRDAVRAVIYKTLKPGNGGIIAVGHDGSIWMDFNTEVMARAAADSDGRFEVHLGK